MRQTKIVATIGPASETPRMLPRLLRAGVDIVRLNFSHGDYAEMERIVRDVRRLSRKLGRKVTILQDLQGPKLRVGEIAPGTRYATGSTITVTTRPAVGDAKLIPVLYPKLVTDLKRGDVILLADGLIELKVVSTDTTELKAKVIHGGPLVSHQGFNVPSAKLSVRPFTPKDRQDLAWGLKHKVDWVAISFVTSPADIKQVRRAIARQVPKGHQPKLIAKIEKHEAVRELDAIITAADGVMVARGDLGVEVDPAEVPFIQKQIIHHANRAGKPVITATQMLESMVDHPRATRAEVSDIANAVLDGTDAVMLSEETAVGQYPLEAVRTMAHVASDAEKHRKRHRRIVPFLG